LSRHAKKFTPKDIEMCIQKGQGTWQHMIGVGTPENKCQEKEEGKKRLTVVQSLGLFPWGESKEI